MRARHEGRGTLAGDTVVTTVMANLGFRRAMDDAGIHVIAKSGRPLRPQVMQRSGAVLGGEQSGHVIFADHASTGDGLLTAVRFLSTAARRGVSVGELASCMRRFPGPHQRGGCRTRGALESTDAVWGAVRAAEASLGDAGQGPGSPVGDRAARPRDSRGGVGGGGLTPRRGDRGGDPRSLGVASAGPSPSGRLRRSGTCPSRTGTRRTAGPRTASGRALPPPRSRPGRRRVAASRHTHSGQSRDLVSMLMCALIKGRGYSAEVEGA